jgi:hypothetical protein
VFRIFFEAGKAEILLPYNEGGRDTWDNARCTPTTTTAPKPLFNEKAKYIQFQKITHYNDKQEKNTQ